MKTFNFDVNFHHFEFVCSSRNTRNGFAHHCSLIVDGGDIDVMDHTCFYYNRTWERYDYQTVMRGLVREQIEILIKWRRSSYMEERGYKRMTQKRLNDFKQWIDDNPGDWIHSYICLYEAVENYSLMEPPCPDWYGHRPISVKPSDFAR